MPLPTRKQKHWMWMMGEIAVDWIEIPSRARIFQDEDGIPLHIPKGESYMLVLFGSIGERQGDGDPSEDDTHEGSDSECALDAVATTCTKDPTPVDPEGVNQYANRQSDWNGANGHPPPCQRGLQVKGPTFERAIRSVIESNHSFLEIQS